MVTAKPGSVVDVADVPVLFNGTTTAELTGTTGAVASNSVSMTISRADGGSTLYELPSDTVGSYGSSLSLIPNVEYVIDMIADVSIANNSGGASASIDPMMDIDPSFLFADDFQLLFSPGIGNSASPVPEPSTWAILLGGLAGLGVARLWASRRTTRAAA